MKVNNQTSNERMKILQSALNTIEDRIKNAANFGIFKDVLNLMSVKDELVEFIKIEKHMEYHKVK
jgi:hypothetical protein